MPTFPLFCNLSQCALVFTINRIFVRKRALTAKKRNVIHANINAHRSVLVHTQTTAHNLLRMHYFMLCQKIHIILCLGNVIPLKCAQINRCIIQI